MIDRIYAAALDRDVWQDVTEGISAHFGGAPTLLGLMWPNDEEVVPRHACGIAPEFLETYLEHLFRDLPWSTRYIREFTGRWGSMGEVLGHVELANTSFYTEWMKPQGLAPRWPVGYSIQGPNGETVGGFGVFTREGQPEIDAERLEGANLWVPHLRRAAEIHLTMAGARLENLALAQAIDRLPTGLLLLDAKRRVVVQNQGARRIASERDGFRIDAGGPGAEDARENATLQKLIADALDAQAGHSARSAGFVAVSRPSGERAYAVMVTPLLAEIGPGPASRAVVAVFVADPAARVVAGPEALEELYQLTHSEAELVRLLASGMSLDEAAEQRGVSLHTARSHLKHAFAKTGTSRQGELVRLIVSGVGQIREG